MNLNALLEELRTSRLDDTVKKYLWSDAELVSFLNDAVTQVILRQRALTESQDTSICSYQIAPGQQLVKLHPLVIAVRQIRYIDSTGSCSTREPLRGMTARRLSKKHPRWDIEDPGVPEFWIPDYQERHIAISRRPVNAGVLKMLVWRRPKPCEELSLGARDREPVIDPLWHPYLMDWAEVRAFGKDDIDTKDEARAATAEAKFTARVGRLPSATEVRLWGVSRAVGSRAQFL